MGLWNFIKEAHKDYDSSESTYIFFVASAFIPGLFIYSLLLGKSVFYSKFAQKLNLHAVATVLLTGVFVVAASTLWLSLRKLYKDHVAWFFSDNRVGQSQHVASPQDMAAYLRSPSAVKFLDVNSSNPLKQTDLAGAPFPYNGSVASVASGRDALSV